ncbi:MAG: hypothetical protein WAZ27_00655 [Minisyncoccia bacterium]
METEIAARLSAQDTKLEEIRVAVEATRKYMQFTFWITVVFLVLPLVGILYAVPKAMSSYSAAVNMDTLEILNGL